MIAQYGISIDKRKALCWALLILAAATLLVYAVSFFNGFVLDDGVIIVNNPTTRHLSNIRDLLFAPDVVKPYYRPLNRASYLLDYHFFGMNPVWFHAVNILIHMLNAVLLYLVGCRLLSDRGAALAAALLFAVHPVNTEAVNFIAARNTLLALSFSLASLLAYIKAKADGVRWPFFSAFLFFLGLLSKETALMLIAVLSLYSVFPLPFAALEKWRDRVLSMLPFLFFAAVYFAMRSYALQGLVGAAVPFEGLFSRLAQNYHIVPQYVGLLLFPADLTIFHFVPTGGLFATPWFLPVWVALFIVVWLIVRRRNEAALFGLVWLAVNYLPISNIVPIPSDSLTERFLYLPAAGIFLMFGAFMAWLRSAESTKKAALIATCVIAIACATVSVKRNLEWKDDFTLFSSGVSNNPASAEAHYNLGTALQDRGDLGGARREWEAALRLDPANSDALIQMGTFWAKQGDLQTAESYYDAALRGPPGKADPGKVMMHYNLGKIYEKTKRPEQALQQYVLFLKKVTSNYEEYKPEVENRIAVLRAAMFHAAGQ
jgi:tetratricopeptide (TPR) repeat protein